MTITRDDILQRLKAKPFRPFRVRLRNGRVFRVREADDLWAGLSGSLVFDSGRNDFALTNVRSVVAVEMSPSRKAPH
ncbi:MAG: hypothetical protein FJ399_24585 [Verrucomicrobia bacterium]|nr:hypothetical protein [Verrucomicrobiota bacterium]